MQRRSAMPQRTLLIVLLLLGANASADLVALSWTQNSQNDYGIIAYFALLEAQLSAVCIWSALRSQVNIWTRIVPIGAAIGCSIAFSLIDGRRFAAKDFLPYFGLHAAALLAALWAFRRSAYWQRRSGVKTEWQFSLAHLLFIMTIVALLTAGMRHSDIFLEDRLTNMVLLVSSVILAVVSVFIWSLASHWIFRLAGVFATAIGLAAMSYFVDDSPPFLMMFSMIDYLVQGVVLVTWLSWGEILPVSHVPAVAET